MDHSLVLIELEREESQPNGQVFAELVGVEYVEVGFDDLADGGDAVVSAVPVGLLLLHAFGDLYSVQESS